MREDSNSCSKSNEMKFSKNISNFKENKLQYKKILMVVFVTEVHAYAPLLTCKITRRSEEMLSY